MQYALITVRWGKTTPAALDCLRCSVHASLHPSAWLFWCCGPHLGSNFCTPKMIALAPSPTVRGHKNLDVS